LHVTIVGSTAGVLLRKPQGHQGNRKYLFMQKTTLEKKKNNEKREEAARNNKLEEEKRKSRNQDKKQPIMKVYVFLLL
jgi:hypothetical protein